MSHFSQISSEYTGEKVSRYLAAEGQYLKLFNICGLYIIIKVKLLVEKEIEMAM